MLRFLFSRLAIALSVAAVAGCVATATMAAVQPEKLKADQTHGRTAQLLADLLATYHLAPPQSDEELGTSSARLFIQALDPERVYFLQAEVDEFLEKPAVHASQFRRGDLDWALAVAERRQARIRRRAAYVRELLTQDQDWRRLAATPDSAAGSWASSEEMLRTRWAAHAASLLLISSSDRGSAEEGRAMLLASYEGLLERAAELSADAVVAEYLNAWAGAYDRGSAYLRPRGGAVDVHRTLSLQGVGVMLQDRGDFPEVVNLVPGGPAERSGKLRVGDEVLQIGDKGRKMHSLMGWPLVEVVEVMRGRAGSTVRLTVRRVDEGKAALVHVDLKRGPVTLEQQSVQGRIVEVERGAQRYPVAVVKVPSLYMDFAAADAGRQDYRSSARDLRKLLAELRAREPVGLILDLRGNEGGALAEVAEVAGLFLSPGPVLVVAKHDDTQEVLKVTRQERVFDAPVVILVDSQTASGAEALAAALRDRGRAVVIGQRTYGAGTVQTLVDLARYADGAGGRLKLTIASLHRITGEALERSGLEPDLALPEPAAQEVTPPFEVRVPATAVRAVSDRGQDIDAALSALRARHADRLDEGWKERLVTSAQEPASADTAAVAYAAEVVLDLVELAHPGAVATQATTR